VASQNIAVSNSLARVPSELQAVKRAVTFTGAFTQELNFLEEYQTGAVPTFQSVYVDNSLNPNGIVITVQGTGQRIPVPGNYIGAYPALMVSNGNASLYSAGAGETTLFFTTMSLQTFTAPASNSSAVGAATAANQATQISQGATANTLLNDILTALSSGGGDATAGNQLTEIARLESIITGIASLATQATAAQQYAELQAINTELDNIMAKLNGTIDTKPVMTSGGNIQVQTSATGASWVTFASQAVRQMTLVNNSGTDIEFRQGGGGIAIKIGDGSAFTVMGINNANLIDIRRVDISNTQVFVQARWES
jgi:hypothetical protein